MDIKLTHYTSLPEGEYVMGRRFDFIHNPTNITMGGFYVGQIKRNKYTGVLWVTFPESQAWEGRWADIPLCEFTRRDWYFVKLDHQHLIDCMRTGENL